MVANIENISSVYADIDYTMVLNNDSNVVMHVAPKGTTNDVQSYPLTLLGDLINVIGLTASTEYDVYITSDLITKRVINTFTTMEM